MPPKELSTISSKKTILIIFFFGVFFITFFSLYHFQVKKIIVVDNKKNNQAINGLTSIKNQLIFTVNEREISDFLLKNNPQLDEVRLLKKLPDTIFIYPQFATAIAQLKTNHGFFLLSKKGRIIKKNKKQFPSFPIINFYQLLDFYQYQTGNNLNIKEILLALEVLEKLKNLKFNKINTIDIKSYDVIIFNKGKEKIYINTTKDKKLLFYEIESIIRKNEIEGKKIKFIDLRFNKPIVTLYE